jgi:FdhD protein
MKASDVRAAARWRGGTSTPFSRELPEETPVALVHDATTTAVMMATPVDLEDLGIGFSLTERIVARPDQITGVECVAAGDGVEVRMWLAGDPSAMLAARRRTLAGPTGCGLCGVDSLAEATRAPPKVGEGQTTSPDAIHAAVAALSQAQQMGAVTRAMHAAGWWTERDGLVAIREDVGRHNALDKLVGALSGGPRADGLLVLTSRVSVEMVQKAAVLGAQILIAISAPTTLAVRTAEACGMTLVAVAREDGFEVYTGRGRIAA